ncbi:MAG: phosphoglucosamine mutase, partial [bacterium]
CTIMTPVSQSLFTISGLRGIVGADLTSELVARYAAGFGNFVGPGAVALGRDSRLSGEMLLSAAAAGLTGSGCAVVDLGICPTPTVLHYTRTNNLRGGIIVTASHNPDRWNGMKFCSSDGTFLSPAAVEEFRARLDAGEPRQAEWLRLQPMRRDPGAVAAHIAAILSSDLFPAPARKLRVGIDAVNGAASDGAVALVRALGAEPVPVYCDPSPESMRSGFPRRPEPVPDGLGALCQVVRAEGLDLGMAFDPDGDRFSCVDETGTPLGEEATICLACRYVLARRPGPVVVNLSTTRAVEDVCAPFGVTVTRSAVGEAAVVEQMRSVGASVGGEGNGGVILPEVNFTRDGLVAAAIALELCAEKKLSALRGELPVYKMVKTSVPLSREGFESRRAALFAAFPGCAVDERDGLKLDGEGFWLHVRASNTEPIARIIAEARSGVAVEPLIERARAALVPEDSQR